MRTLFLILALVLSMTTIKAQTLDPFYQYTYSDSLNNADSAFVTLPALMLSAWSYNWGITFTRASGTHNITSQVMESNTTKGTDWYPINGAKITTTGNAVQTWQIAGPLIYGMRQRLKLVGTGTQKVYYTINFVAKKTFK
jgi:hypothetical protein